ncbi:histamine H4 receptor isoform X2 [Peromyscus eremicus]|uniref:histamine H4 receptor isoform X2 n=1 Tax=Peromyscus eremicus TaxID=42410 RepID=UPI0027DB96DA|nr:histamine H4 receptor isoform X2 [Peromyscus eremicus]
MLNANSSGSLPLAAKVSLAFFMSLLAFAIMLGNAVVILAFVVDKNLRHRSNYFFLNLAISDFFVGKQSWRSTGSVLECEPGFVTEWYVLAVTSFLEFLVPVISVAYFNVQIYWCLWKRGSLTRCPSHVGFVSTSSSDSGPLPRAGLVSRTSLPALKESAPPLHSESPRRKSSLLVSFRTHMNSRIIAFKEGSFSHSETWALHHREHTELLRGRKLARSLAILLTVFAICWAPYCLFTIVLSTYPEGKRTKSVWYSIAFWLQWFHSFVNPFLYPLCHRRFQKAFWKIFCVKKQPAPSQNRSISS